MPDKTGRLTPQEALWVEYVERTGDAVYAAEKAGYRSPAARASQNLAKPDLAARRNAVRERLRAEGAEVGYTVLVEIATDKKNPVGARRAAASDLVKFSGIGHTDAEEGLQPHEMTPDQLAREINRLMLVASDKAKEPEVVDQPAPQPEMGCLG